MPRKNPDAYRRYMKDYMVHRRAAVREDLAARRGGLVAAGKATASGRERVEVDGRDVPDEREYALRLPAVSPYWS